MMLGMVLAVHGPTLLDLSHQTGGHRLLDNLDAALFVKLVSHARVGADIAEIGRIFTARSIGCPILSLPSSVLWATVAMDVECALLLRSSHSQSHLSPISLFLSLSSLILWQAILPGAYLEAIFLTAPTIHALCWAAHWL